MSSTVFRVIAPARTADGLPDPQPVYAGGAVVASGDVRGHFSGANVFGGARVGQAWQGCTYTRPPFVNPGVGQIEQV